MASQWKVLSPHWSPVHTLVRPKASLCWICMFFFCTPGFFSLKSPPTVQKKMQVYAGWWCSNVSPVYENEWCVGVRWWMDIIAIYNDLLKTLTLTVKMEPELLIIRIILSSISKRMTINGFHMWNLYSFYKTILACGFVYLKQQDSAAIAQVCQKLGKVSSENVEMLLTVQSMGIFSSLSQFKWSDKNLLNYLSQINPWLRRSFVPCTAEIFCWGTVCLRYYYSEMSGDISWSKEQLHHSCLEFIKKVKLVFNLRLFFGRNKQYELKITVWPEGHWWVGSIRLMNTHEHTSCKLKLGPFVARSERKWKTEYF